MVGRVRGRIDRDFGDALRDVGRYREVVAAMSADRPLSAIVQSRARRVRFGPARRTPGVEQGRGKQGSILVLVQKKVQVPA